MRFSLLAAAMLPAAAAGETVRFERDIRPILEQHCTRCHGAEAAAKGLRLHREERAMMAVVKGRPDESRLYLAALTKVMPPGDRKLTQKELKLLRTWIERGAKWPKGLELQNRPIQAER